jgi:hypothetical protein
LGSAASVRVEGAAATARILSRGFRRSNAALASEVDGLEEEEDEDAASREGAIVVVIVGGGEGAVVDSSAATPTAAPVVDVVVASASATTYVADATFPIVVVGGVVGLSSRSFNFFFARQQVMRWRALALRRSAATAVAFCSLILSAACFASFFFARLRAMLSRVMALRRLMMVASASIAGIVWLWMK